MNREKLTEYKATPLKKMIRTVYYSLVVGVFSSFLFLGMNDHVRAQSVCHQIFSQTSMPSTTDYAPPYNLFSSGADLLIKIYCDASEVEATVGDGDELTYIYEYGHTWRGNSWQQIQLSGQTKISAWYIGNANTFLPQQGAELANDNYFLAYLCKWIPAEETWKCGCRDTQCSANHWNLQIFRGESTPGQGGGNSSGGGNATVEEAENTISASRYREIVTKLSSNEFEGRKVNTQGGEKTIQYVISWFEDIGLLPAVNGSYRQRYQSIASNVIGYLPGNDPNVGDEVVIITAHHDHLGKRGCVYHGAIDNSSGTAAVIELAHALYEMRNTIKRTVVFMTTDGEETPQCTGSNYYVFEDPVFPINKHVYNLNIDMVGGFRGSSRSFLEIDKSSAHTANASSARTVYCDVDSEVFQAAGVRATTVDGRNPDYHECSDTAANMDFDKAMNGVYHSFDIAIREIQK